MAHHRRADSNIETKSYAKECIDAFQSYLSSQSNLSSLREADFESEIVRIEREHSPKGLFGKVSLMFNNLFHLKDAAEWKGMKDIESLMSGYTEAVSDTIDQFAEDTEEPRAAIAEILEGSPALRAAEEATDNLQTVGGGIFSRLGINNLGLMSRKILKNTKTSLALLKNKQNTGKQK